jgi:hypothetical protein
VNTIPNDRAAELAAAAYAARRAARPAWRNAHSDRLAREVEARRIAKEYRAEQRKTASAHKHCRDCDQTKPVSAFELLPSGGLRGICRDCRTAQKVAQKHRARAAKRESPEHQAELERKQREREQQQAEREAAKVREAEQLQAAKEAEWAALRAAEETRRRKRQERKRGVRKRPLSAEQQREIAERIPQLVSLLMGSHPRERLSDQKSWEATATELSKLWLQSGGKQCVACKAVVPPTKLLPPGPANFYPGHCRSCATAACNANTLRVTGKPPPGPRLIPMKDGTAITVAEFACRVRERSLGPRA